MAWQVIEFMENNPELSTKQIVSHFAQELEIDHQIKCLQKEVDKVLELRDRLKPLYGKKLNTDVQLASLDSEFEMEVMIKYPPRQGSDKERKAYKASLQAEHVDYQELSRGNEVVKEEIVELETQMADVQQRAKNARRLLETFNHYMSYIIGHSFNTVEPDQSKIQNANMF